MATAVYMADMLSRALRISAADARHRVRRLREGQLIAGQGHGRRAPAVNAHDAATLLIAILATDTASHVAEAVATVGKHLGKPLHAKGRAFMPARTFVDAVADLVERMRDPDAVAGVLQAVAMIGVTQSANTWHGWIEVLDVGNLPHRERFLGGSRFSDGSDSVVIVDGLNAVGAFLRREVAVPAAALWVLAEVLGESKSKKRTKAKL